MTPADPIVSDTDGKLPIACDRCGRSVRVKPTAGGNPRPPIGWTLIDAGYWCSACWDDVYIPRSVTVGVTSADWPALRAVLKESFAAARSLANWAYSALYNSEPPRDPGAEKMPKKPAVYLYGLAKERCPFWGTLPAPVANAVLRQVESDYSADRYESVWTGARSNRNYTYPAPLPIPAQCWTLRKSDDGYEASMPLAHGQRVTVPLIVRRHQARILDQLLATPLLSGACKLVENRSFADRDTNARENSNGARFSSRLRLMISYYAPRLAAPAVPESEWRVSTCGDSLLVAVDAESAEVWRYHADHAKRIATLHHEHCTRLGRLSDDRKAETRRPRREARPRLAMLSARSERDRNRLRSVCHEISMHMVKAAQRRKIARLVWDDTDKSFCPSFPWAMLRGMVDQKCRAVRIQFIHANAPAPRKRREPLATK